MTVKAPPVSERDFMRQGGLRAAAQALVDYLAEDAVIDGEHGVRVISRSSELVVALRAALDAAQPAPPALDRERLARALYHDPDPQPYMLDDAAAIADAYEADR